MPETDTFFYRFRSARSALEQFQELEKQEIFFSEPEHLNDPMEGFRDIIWRGDVIVWRCFFKHYILCLMQTISALIVSGREEYDAIEQHDFSNSTVDQLATQALRDTYERCCATFFADDIVDQLPKRLASANHIVRRSEILFILSVLHSRAIASIFEVFYQKELGPNLVNTSLSDIPSLESLSEEFFAHLDRLATIDEGDEKLAEFFAATGQIGPSRVTLRHNEGRIGWARIVLDFPESYLDRLHHIMYPNWFVSCFVKNHSHSAMWGNYADSHRGICLKFRQTLSANKKPALRLHRVTGLDSNGYTESCHPIEFKQVAYKSKFPPVDFFTSIGTLPAASLQAQWYTGDNGEVSTVAKQVLSEDDSWINSYWDQYEASLTTKLPDWAHESEQRLIIGGNLINYSAIHRRKLRYEFEDLAGIIFGIKTTATDKLAIVDIIRKKCSETSRSEFSFYQARYSHLTGKIEASALPNML